MKKCCYYLITGPSHLANLAVSLISLRNHWQGEIVVHAWPQSIDIATKICADPNIDARCEERTAAYQRKNAQEIAKIAYIQEMHEWDQIVYIDADTIIRKPITPLFDECNTHEGFVGTQFCDWFMRQGIPRRRVERLRGIPGIHQGCVELALKPQRYSYNSGIFACRPSSRVLPVWGEWTTLSKHIYISGETALHAVAMMFPIMTMTNGVYNNSPIFQSKTLSDSEVAIWHFHGDCNVRPNKSERGTAIWYQDFEKVMARNIGEIQSWVTSIGNEFLCDLLKQSYSPAATI